MNTRTGNVLRRLDLDYRSGNIEKWGFWAGVWALYSKRRCTLTDVCEHTYASKSLAAQRMLDVRRMSEGGEV